jgi:hypothetical protein
MDRVGVRVMFKFTLIIMAKVRVRLIPMLGLKSELRLGLGLGQR